MEKINIDFSKNELNKFLIGRYGYGYWSFADSLNTIHSIYKLSDVHSLDKLYRDRIAYLEIINQKIIEIIDKFLIDIEFYKNSKFHRNSELQNFIWTPNNKKAFILDRFFLKDFSMLINELKRNYEEKSLFYTSIKTESPKIYLKPINFIIVTWSYAFKRKGRVEWINMELLLKWFLKAFGKLDILDVFQLDDRKIAYPERMRFIFNKYKETEHGKVAYSIFVDSFLKEEEIKARKRKILISLNGEKIDYSDPLIYLYEDVWYEKSPVAILMLEDMGTAYHLLEDMKF